MNIFDLKNLSKKAKITTIIVALSSIILSGILIHMSFNSNAEDSAIKRLRDIRNKTLAKTININKDDTISVRAIVVLEEDSVALSNYEDSKKLSEYSAELKKQEKKLLDNQDSIISAAEEITDTKVINQTSYLVNSFSLNATRNELDELAALDGVAQVYEASTYEVNMTEAARIGNINKIQDNTDYGYTGEGTVVAVLDTGVNYQHKDMVLVDGAKTKYTKEEWLDKIAMLGYGKYCSDKVPFGYDYATGTDECLNTRGFHGYHVAGIIGANGMLTGVAPNAQILGIKVLSNDGVGTTDDLVKGIEDAVKLGADIINMSLGYKCTVKSDEDYLQSAINEAKESGVLCAIAAGNDGSSASGSNSNNLIGAIDTSAVGSPAVSNGSFCVASVDNISEDINDEDVRNSVVMSDFSSWGPTNELNIKPEIAAPGGNINSLYDGWSSYVELSGTSMATPYISGCSALVLNSIKARKLNIPEDEFTKYIKSTLINTATPLNNPENGQPYSVRYQGAGLVDTFNAVRNDVIITCNDEAKIELGEINESNNNTTFTINLKNYGNNDVRYRINCETLYSNYTDKETGAYGIIPVEGSGVVFDTLHNNEVCVKKGEDISITCTIELGDLESESFIEGFISFENLYDNDSPSLNIPLLGFYGDWSKETIIDSSIYSGEESVFAKEKNLTSNKMALTGLVGLSDSKDTVDTYLGLYENISDGELSAFSPNNDSVRDYVAPIVAALRSPKEVKISILDSEFNHLETIDTCTNLKKISNYSLYEKIQASVMKSSVKSEIIAWDGTLYDHSTGESYVADDGQYYIQLESKITDKSKPQTITMPVKIDTCEPVLENFDYLTSDEDSEQSISDDTISNNKNVSVSFNISDNIGVSPYVYVDIEKNGRGQTKAYQYSALTKNTEDNYVLELNATTDSVITIMWEDMAGNEVFKTIDMSEDAKIDYVLSDEDELNLQIFDGVIIDKNLSNNAYISLNNDSYTLTGRCIEGYTVFINGKPVKYKDGSSNGKGYNHTFSYTESVNVSTIKAQQMSVNIQVKDTESNIVFEQTYNMTIDNDNPTITVDESAFSKATKCSMINKYYMYVDKTATEIAKESICFDVKIDDANIDADSFYAVIGTLTKDGDNVSTFENSYTSSKISHTYKGNGVYNIELSTSDEDEELYIRVNDKAGNMSYMGVHIYTSDKEKDYINRCDVNAVKYNLDLPTNILTKEMLANSDDDKLMYTIRGQLNAMPDSLTINNDAIEANTTDMTFYKDIMLSKGCTKLNFAIKNNYNEITFFENLYYDDINIQLLDNNNNNNNEINTNESSDIIKSDSSMFTINGTINSYISVGKIDINGQNVYSTVNGVISDNGNYLTHDFSYNVKLQPGTNVIKIKVTGAMGHVYERVVVVQH